MYNRLELQYRNSTWFTEPLLGAKSVYSINIKVVDSIYYVCCINHDTIRIVSIDVTDNYTKATKVAKVRLQKMGVKFKQQIRKTF